MPFLFSLVCLVCFWSFATCLWCVTLRYEGSIIVVSIVILFLLMKYVLRHVREKKSERPLLNEQQSKPQAHNCCDAAAATMVDQVVPSRHLG